MMALDIRITMAEIARTAEVSLSTVSNWRRRHESFPASKRKDGQETFSIDEVAKWLDGRKIAKSDLNDFEMPGATYGARFRRNNPQIESRSDVSRRESLRQQEILWRGLDRFRGAEDIASHANLVLTLLYLSVRERDRWAAVLAADGPESASLAEGMLFEYESSLGRPSLSWRSVATASQSTKRFVELIRLIDQVRRRADHEIGSSQKWVGEVFDYLLHKFAAAEGKRGAVVVTPPSVVKTLVELIAPKPGERLLDPCIDFGGFLIGAAHYIETHGGRASDASLTGHALLERAWSIARMNLDLHGISADLIVRPGVAFGDDLDLGGRFDTILANPPFNMSDWSGGHPDHRHWRFGSPPHSNANFAWLQYIWSSLAEGGRAAVVMANGALTSEQAGERRIRAAMVEAGVVEALVALPPQLFSTTAIPVTVWLLRGPGDLHDDETLFVDGRDLGTMVSRSQRDLLPAEIRLIAKTVHDWRDRRSRNEYVDVRGFSASVGVEAIRENSYQLTPGRYVGTRQAAYAPAVSVAELRRELDRLNQRAVEIDAIVDHQLDRIDRWTL